MFIPVSMMLNFITWLRCCLPGLSIVNLQFTAIVLNSFPMGTYFGTREMPPKRIFLIKPLA